MSFHYIAPHATRGLSVQIEHHLTKLAQTRKTKNCEQNINRLRACNALRWQALWRILNHRKSH